MIPANKLYYLSKADDSIHVLMQKEKVSNTYKFYDTSKTVTKKLKIALFSVNGGIVLCYELEEKGVIIAEDTSNILPPNVIPGLVSAIFFDVFPQKV